MIFSVTLTEMCKTDEILTWLTHKIAMTFVLNNPCRGQGLFQAVVSNLLCHKIVSP